MDQAETSLWSSLLKKGDIVIDGGANLGYFTLLASNIVGNEGHVISYEPVKQTANALRRNIHASRCNNVTVIEAALSDEKGIVTLNLYDNDPFLGNASICEYPDKTRIRNEKSLCIPLDDLLRHNIHPDFIKLDIEGSELSALKGALGLLQNENPPLICFEWNEYTADRMGFHPNQILIFLKNLGYSPFLKINFQLIPFFERKDIEQWIPMVWCFKNGAMMNRAIRAGFMK